MKKNNSLKIDLASFNMLGLDHQQVKLQFGKQLKYVGTFCIKGEYTPRAFYYQSKPDRSKNHKDYMTLQNHNGITYVSGIDKKELELYRYIGGLICLACGDVIYSTYRHDYRNCECQGCFVDGGADYERFGGEGFGHVLVDLLKGTYRITS